jgi:hypothetical protein
MFIIIKEELSKLIKIYYIETNLVCCERDVKSKSCYECDVYS